MRENSDEVPEEWKSSDHAEQHRGNGVAHPEYARETLTNVGSCISFENISMRKVAATCSRWSEVSTFGEYDGITHSLDWRRQKLM